MQYKHKSKPRVYTARSRQSGALKFLVIGIFVVGLAILLISFCQTLHGQTRVLQINEPRPWLCAENQIYACSFPAQGI